MKGRGREEVPASVIQGGRRGRAPFTGGWNGGVGRKRACRFPVHYVGCWWNHWDLFEYLLGSRKREHGGFHHTEVPGLLRMLVGSIGLLEDARVLVTVLSRRVGGWVCL